MFGLDTEKESLRRENAELRKELMEIRQKKLLKDLLNGFQPLGQLGQLQNPQLEAKS